MINYFMQGIYGYIPETRPFSRVQTVAAALYSQFVLHVMLFPVLNVLYFTSALSAVSVQCPIWMFFVVP